MKRVKVLVPVILQVWDDNSRFDTYELELNENSVDAEINHLEVKAYHTYQDGQFELLEDDNE
jgi:hypothetical protein